MMFIDLLNGDVQQAMGYFCCMTGSKYLEYNPGSELNILLVNTEIESNKMIEWNTEQKLKKDK